MKRHYFLSTVIALVLVVGAISCTTMTPTEGYPGRAERVYVDDPYRGTVVLERDPYTGRYYEVDSYGNANGYYYRGNRYNRNYGGNNRNSNNRNYSRNRNYYEGQNNTQRPSNDQTEERERSRQEARRKILGN